MNENYKNILIVKNRAMGDSIMGLSTISYIRELYPHAKIFYALPSWITPLYENVNTDADEIIAFDLKKLSDWGKLWKICRSRNIDLVYEMHQAGRTAKFFKSFSFLTRTPYFFHNHHLKSGTEVLDQGVIKAIIQRDLDGAYSFLSDKEFIPKFFNYCPKMKVIKDLTKKNKVILGVVATRETKMWSFSNYFDLAKIIKTYFPDTEIIIPLSKSVSDLEIKKTLIDLGIEKFASIIHSSLAELPIVIGEAKLYVGNDTGLKHLAIATGVKSYTLFGPEPPNEWHPYNKENHPYFYFEELECRTKDAHYCGLSKCETMLCLKEFSAQRVFERIKKDLN